MVVSFTKVGNIAEEYIWGWVKSIIRYVKFEMLSKIYNEILNRWLCKGKWGGGGACNLV